MNINLHSVVRGAINSVHADETVTIYRSNGNTVDDEGLLKPSYSDAITVQANVQTESSQELVLDNIKGSNTVAYRFYLYSDSAEASRIAGIIRPLARGGDMIKRSNGLWYLVTAVKDDFSAEGWESVIATLQDKGVDTE